MPPMSIRGPSVKNAVHALARLVTDVRAATAIEYGLIVSLIVIAMIVGLVQVAGTTVDMWNNVNSKVTAAH